MFRAVVTDKGNLKVLELSDGHGTAARFVPERGGILAELTLSGVTVFYLDEATLQDLNKNIRGGSPVLFPVCGPLEEGRYELEGKLYPMQQHGFARNLPWQVADMEAFADSARVVLQLKADSWTAEVFPFDFELFFTYEITPALVRIEQRYRNLSSSGMPFYGGFHPYFLLPGRQINELHIPSNKCFDLKRGLEKPFDGTLDLASEEETNLVFTALTDSKAAVRRKDGAKITVHFDHNFRYLVLWALRDKDFMCIEPWMGNNYDMNRGKALVLGPGEELRAEVSYQIETK